MYVMAAHPTGIYILGTVSTYKENVMNTKHELSSLVLKKLSKYYTFTLPESQRPDES